MFGAPVAGATVAFAPTADGQPTAFAKTDAQGNFTLTTYEFGDGAAVGKFKVVVSKAVSAGTAESESGGDGHGSQADYEASLSHSAEPGAGGDKEAAMVPAQYSSAKTTPLSAEVSAGGENVFPLVIE